MLPTVNNGPKWNIPLGWSAWRNGDEYFCSKFEAKTDNQNPEMCSYMEMTAIY